MPRQSSTHLFSFCVAYETFIDLALGQPKKTRIRVKPTPVSMDMGVANPERMDMSQVLLK